MLANELNSLFGGRFDLDRRSGILDKVDFGLIRQDTGSCSLSCSSIQSERVDSLDRRTQVLSVKVEHEWLTGGKDESLVSSNENRLKFVGRVGCRLCILLEPVPDLK